MGLMFYNKMTLYRENSLLKNFISNEKYSVYLRKYKQKKIIEDSYGEKIEYELDDFTQPSEDYEIKNNEFSHYSETWKHTSVRWLLEMSKKYPELKFKIYSSDEYYYTDYYEMRSGNIIEKKTTVITEWKSTICEDGKEYFEAIEKSI